MSNVSIIMELCKEDRARLDRLIEILERQSSCGSCAQAITDTVHCITGAPGRPVQLQGVQTRQGPINTPPQDEKPAEAATAPQGADIVEEITKRLLTKVRELVRAGKREAAKAIVEHYAPSVSEIPVDKRAEALQDLIALEGGQHESVQRI